MSVLPGLAFLFHGVLEFPGVFSLASKVSVWDNQISVRVVPNHTTLLGRGLRLLLLGPSATRCCQMVPSLMPNVSMLETGIAETIIKEITCESHEAPPETSPTQSGDMRAVGDPILLHCHCCCHYRYLCFPPTVSNVVEGFTTKIHVCKGAV